MAEGGIGRTGSVSESNIIHSSLYSHHSQNQVESLSLEICTILTKLGYGEEIRRRRIEKYKESDRRRNRGNNNVTIITAGSKGEGLTCFYESDRDFLFIMSGVLCVEAGIHLHTIPDDIHVFRMDTRLNPGHCRLLLERQRKNMFNFHDTMFNALCDNGCGDILLSSCLWVDEWSALGIKHNIGHGRVQLQRAGPSIPETINGVFSLDTVHGLRCFCPSILQRWADRPRYWPPPAIVKKVVSYGAFVTPVGVKGSEYNHMEWRICFNTGETELVNNLNDTQVKVYVMLKIILKELIKPNNKEITSYVLKNIILWQAENTPQTQFHTRSLFYWLHDGLSELRTALEKKLLPYYMIPERNLMANCGLEDALQSKWIANITEMMTEGPRVILRLEKIRRAIIASPEPMLWFSKKRMEMEMLQLELSNRRKQCQNENMMTDTYFIMKAIERRLEKIFFEAGLRMLQEGSSIDDFPCRILM